MTQTEFIQTIGPIIQKHAKLRGYKVCSPIIAQACVESAYGKSSLAAKYHNYFGMKCGSSWKGKSVNMSTKEEYKAGTLTSIKANFRAYDSMEEGVIGYFDFISTSRYANLKNATTPNEYLEFIKKDGYATNSTYVATNMSVVNKFKLTVYDTSQAPATNPTIKVGDKVRVLKAVQYDGKSFKAYYPVYDVISIKGDRVVIGKGKTVTCAVKISNVQAI